MNAALHSDSGTVRVHWPDGRVERARLESIGKSGGAGEVFAMQGRPDWVAKIYHPTIARAQRAHYEQKIQWMIRNRPELPQIPPEHKGIVQLAWPAGVVRSDAGFAGFVMEKIDFTRTMELDYLLTRRQSAAEGFEADFGKLVTICCNLASLIHCLHSRKIAVVDLKPINLKVYKSELYVSILDCDGFHITSDSFVSDAPQVTPEYLAPEFQEHAVAHPAVQDAFALATIVFRLLNYGIHPFAGIAVGRSNFPSELAARIGQGLYPYARMAARDGKRTLRPAPASVHEALPDDIRDCFDRAFTSPALRPSASEWADLLAVYARRGSPAMTTCPKTHLQFAGKPCATCLREAVLQTHVERHERFVARIQQTPARAVQFVRKTLRGTHSSPFQAALAQGHFQIVQLAPVTRPLRHVLSIEILWTLGLGITYWWLK
jgi:DNA-binding helix-hairpin-helix protein with protein kinase domain